MGVTWKLSLNYLKNNKKRAFIIGICILISTILITTVLLLISSYREYRITQVRNEGNWEVGFRNITYDEACTIENHSNVKEISVMYNLGNYENITHTDAYYFFPSIIGCDENAMKNLVEKNLFYGKMPENSNEVIINSNNNFDKVGDTLVQTLENGERKEYTVVGIMYPYNNLFESNQAITLLDRDELEPDNKVNITVLSNNVNEIYSDYYDIYYQLGSYRNEHGSALNDMVQYNKTLLEYENVLDYTSDFQKNIYTVEGIFIGIIVVCSMIFIYSIINISVIERKKYFGILKSIGATTKQMRRSVRVELLIILLITVPLGILIGIGLDFLLITIINSILPELATSYSSISSVFQSSEGFTFAIPMSTIFVSILIVVLTVYISSMIPIRKVSWLQAISLIKHNKEKVKIKKVRKKTKSIKNVEFTLAIKNIERYKTRYFAIIMSLIISIVLIIVSNYYIVNIASEDSLTDYNYTIGLQYEADKYENLAEQIIDDIQEANIAEKVVSNSRGQYAMLVNVNNISDVEKEFSKNLYRESNNILAHFDLIFASDEFSYNDISDIYVIWIPLLVLNEDAYNHYLNQIGVDGLEENECILVDYIHERTKYYDGIRLTNYNEGDEITIRNGMPGFTYTGELEEDNAKLKIKKITNKIPQNLSYVENGPLIVGTEETVKNIEKQLYGDLAIDDQNEIKYEYISLKVNNIDTANNFIELLKEKYNLNDYDEININNEENYNSIQGHQEISQEDIDNTNLLRNVFIYTFIGIITLVGIFNMYNAINTNLDIRKREVVSLITIGMEKKQINKMLLIENAICGVLALALGIVIGLSVSYMVYLTSIDYNWYSFEIPWLSIVISIVGIVIVTFISTIYLKKKIFSENLIEVLKQEEI